MSTKTEELKKQTVKIMFSSSQFMDLYLKGHHEELFARDFYEKVLAPNGW